MTICAHYQSPLVDEWNREGNFGQIQQCQRSPAVPPPAGSTIACRGGNSLYTPYIVCGSSTEYFLHWNHLAWASMD